MPYNLGDLKARIAEEADRDELLAGGTLENRLAETIARAVEHYADEDFWFKRGEGSASTVGAEDYVDLPATIRVAEDVVYLGNALVKVPLEEILGRTESGQPTHWAENGDDIQLWPIPDAVYSLSVFGAAKVAAPTADADETVWTNEAYDLIAARVRFLLFRDVFRDVEGTQLAAQAESEALSKLRKETRRRSVTSLRSRGDEPWTARTRFNVNQGF